MYEKDWRKEDILLEQGYDYDDTEHIWHKILEESNYYHATQGWGTYTSSHIFDESCTESTLYDRFEGRDIVATREVDPYPFVLNSTKIKTRLTYRPLESTTTCHISTPCAAHKGGNNVEISVGEEGLYLAGYSNRGRLTDVQIYDGTKFVIHFNFKNWLVRSAGNSNPAESFSEHLNSNRLLFNERFYFLTQDPSETAIKMHHPSGQPLIGIVIPTNVSVQNLRSAFQGEGKEWLDQLEQLPFKIIPPDDL